MDTIAHRTRAGLALTLGLAVLALSACSLDTGSGADGGGGPSSSAGTGEGAAPEAATVETDTVRVLTHDSFTLPEELIARFENETGQRVVTTSPGDAGAVANQLRLQEGEPPVDAVFGLEDHAAHAFAEEGSDGPFAEHVPEDLPDSAADLVLDDRLIPVDRGQVCVNVDHAWFQREGRAEPTGLEQLAEPEYASLLALTDPLTSSPGSSFLAATATALGDDWQQWWTDALDNGATVEASWSDAYYTAFSGSSGEGPRPLVLSYSSSPAAEQDTGVIESTCVDQVEYAGVLDGSRNEDGAEQFVDFLLSEDVQAALPESMYMYPVDDSVPLPADWAQKAPLVADPIAVDPAEAAERREDWLKAYAEIAEAHR